MKKKLLNNLLPALLCLAATLLIVTQFYNAVVNS